MDDVLPGLLIQLFDAQPGAVIPVLKVLLGECHVVKILPAARRLQGLDVPGIRVFPVHCRGQDGPGHQHGGVFPLHRRAHALHGGHIVPHLGLPGGGLRPGVKHPVPGPGVLALAGVALIIGLYRLVGPVQVRCLVGLPGGKA